MRIDISNKTKCFFGFLFLAFTINAQQIWVKKSDNQFVLNTGVLTRELKKITPINSKRAILFPNLDGEIVPFIVYDNAVLPTDLARKYPQVHSYKGVSRYNSSQIIRFTCTPSGIEGTLMEANKILNLTSTEGNDEYTLVKEEFDRSQHSSFKCSAKGKEQEVDVEDVHKRSGKVLIGDNKLRTIRIAVTTTGEYSDFFVRKNNLQSGTETQKKAAVIAGISTSLNNINVAFERDLGVRFELIANNDELIFLNKNTDPYTETIDTTILISEVESAINSRGILFSDYDLGHLLHGRGGLGGGFANVGSLCTSTKSGAVTASSTPTGFFFDFTIFAHELGHQLGARHTQSANCQTETPVEVGSGSTIMSYAAPRGTACSGNEVQDSGDPFFHSLSVAQIVPIMNNLSFASDCGVQESITNNSIPSIPFISNYTVPLGLPIYLDANVTDTEDASNLTYSWEQYDQEIGPSPPQTTSTTGPQFRVFSPVSVSRRDFPKSGVNSKWEVLPTVPRTMNFKLFVRDGKPGGIAISNTTQIEIVQTSEQFRITSPSIEIAYDQNATEIITWNVAGTNQPPFNVENVKIEYSYDGGKTYPVILADNLPNTGEGEIKTPIAPIGFSGSLSEGKIRISAVENAFYTFTDKAITLTNVIRDDFPTITMVSRQDLRINSLVFKIKSSFVAPTDIVFSPIFIDADTERDISDLEGVRVSADLGKTYSPYNGENFVMKRRSSELWVAIPLRNSSDVGNTLEKLKMVLFARKNAKNQTVVRTGLLIEDFKSIDDNIVVSNPSPGQVTFTTLVFPIANSYELRIYSVSGKFIESFFLTDTDKEFTLKSLSKGLYLVQISLGDLVTTKKFVIL